MNESNCIIIIVFIGIILFIGGMLLGGILMERILLKDNKNE